jgi:hypothetical protein
VTATATAPAPAHAPENAWAGQGAVLLDIGGDVGALVVAMPETMVGAEIEIRPLRGRAHDRHHEGGSHHHHEHGGTTGDHEHLAHVAVVRRPVRGGEVPSLVFPELSDGGYELFGKGQREAVVLRVDVVGGQVTTTDWPG